VEQKKRVLLIAYYFPPCGMGGVQRAAKLAKYLPQFGWDVTVLTVKDIAYYQKDESLLEDVQSAEIKRTGSLDPLRLAYIFSGKSGTHNAVRSNNIGAKLFRFIERCLFVPDSKKLWIPFAFARAARIIKQQNIRAVISTAPPFSSHILTLFLARSFRLPWVADFREGWTNRDILPPPAFYRSINRILEKLVVKKADKVVGISQRIINFLQEIEPHKKEKFTLVYNGFDEDDFKPRILGAETGNFTITFLGTAAEWTDPSVFIPGICRAAERNPVFKEYLDLQIVGNILHSAFMEAINQSAIKDRTTITGYLPHRQAIKRLMKSNILLFPVTIYNTTGYITGKIYEYLASGIPVLAHTPAGEARNILSQFSDETFFDDGKNDEKTAEFILEKFAQWHSNLQTKKSSCVESEPYKRKDFEIFSRKNQAKTIAGLLDEIIPLSGIRPGAGDAD